VIEASAWLIVAHGRKHLEARSVTPAGNLLINSRWNAIA